MTTKQVLTLSASLVGNPTNGMGVVHIQAMFVLAGLPFNGWTELPNNYWPNVPEYADLRANSPWWSVETFGEGRIVIGWRKRVISIDWSNTPVRKIITKDDVTKSDVMVHAWGYAKAVEYLTSLRYAIR